MSTASGLLTGPQLAKRLGKNTKTIHRWMEQGFIPRKCVKFFGRLPRYSVSLLREEGWEIPEEKLAVSA